MKRLISAIIGILCATSASSAGAQPGEPTLREVRSKYAGKQIVVVGPLFDERSMLEWHAARRDGARFVEAGDLLSLLPSAYKGQVATVVAVQLNRLKLRTKANALGEVVSEDDTVNPYFDLVVQFQDGTFGMLTTYPTTAGMSVRFADEQRAIEELIKTNQEKLIGASLYACDYAHLYEPDASLEEMTGPREILKRIGATRTPIMKPLIIQNLKLINDVVVLKLKLPDASTALAYTPSQMLHTDEGDKPRSPLQIVAGFFLTSVPLGYSTREIEAVQKREIFRGMAKDAVECALGFPKEENDWGNGGKQLVFFDNLFVYLDHNEKVADWQDLHDR